MVIEAVIGMAIETFSLPPVPRRASDFQPTPSWDGHWNDFFSQIIDPDSDSFNPPLAGMAIETPGFFTGGHVRCPLSTHP